MSQISEFYQDYDQTITQNLKPCYPSDPKLKNHLSKKKVRRLWDLINV